MLELNNIFDMKKAVLIFAVALLVILTTLLWMINSQFSGGIREILMFSGVFIIVGFAVFIGIQRLKSHKRKEPVEDEFSKKVMIKTSSLSFYISIYLWLFIMYISDKVELESHSLIGVGILGMAIIFFICWIGIKVFGLRG
jgi:hypothetical protein